MLKAFRCKISFPDVLNILLPKEAVMDRRRFLKRGTAAAAGLAASKGILSPLAKAEGTPAESPIPKRRLGKTGAELSLIAFGGIVVMDTSQTFANNIVAEAIDRGINYFDVAPEYGNAQERLGPALGPHRESVFLACKTLKRDRAGAAEELDQSLKLLHTDHVDLYQFHALTKMKELDQVLGPNGAMEAFQAARKAGKIRFIGFSAHSVETALAALDRYDFDTILFPTNFVLFSQANFGPQVLARAQKKGLGILALKAMAKSTWPAAEKKGHPFSKCWYEPAALPEEASLALRWTLSQPVTAAIPPGEEKYFRLAMDVAQRFVPLKPEEKKTLMARAQGAEPIFHLGNA
jgi:aryl-alcohol dehydrogenase-like predicted oxidoreductase